MWGASDEWNAPRGRVASTWWTKRARVKPQKPIPEKGLYDGSISILRTAIERAAGGRAIVTLLLGVVSYLAQRVQEILPGTSFLGLVFLLSGVSRRPSPLSPCLVSLLSCKEDHRRSSDSTFPGGPGMPGRQGFGDQAMPRCVVLCLPG